MFQFCKISRLITLLFTITGTMFAPATPAQKIAAPPAERWVRPQLTVAAGADMPVRLRDVVVKSEVSGRLVYRLPLEYAATLDSFRLDLNVAGIQAAPASARGQLDGLVFAHTSGGYHAQVAHARYAGRGLLELEMQAVPGAHAYTQNF